MFSTLVLKIAFGILPLVMSQVRHFFSRLYLTVVQFVADDQDAAGEERRDVLGAGDHPGGPIRQLAQRRQGLEPVEKQILGNTHSSKLWA